MPTRSKQKPPRNAIVLGDIVFKLGIREVSGVIHGQQGLDCFICESEGLAIPLPFNVPLQSYGETMTALVRTSDDSLVLEPGEDDVYVDDLDTAHGEMDVTDLAVISDMFEEQKLRVLPHVITGTFYAIGAGIVTLVAYLLKLPLFPAVIVPGCLTFWNIAWSARWDIQLNKSVAYDAAGNWINLETGETSLNGGTFRYRREKRK